MRKQLVQAIATGFYLGKIPFMPGTWGTLLGIPFVWLLAQAHSDIAYMLGTIVLILAGSYVAELHERNTGGHDPGEVVIDEVAGFAVSMTMLPQTWHWYLAAFIVFRIFDIFKPYPISRIDQQVKGGLGTMLDDVAAGLITNIVLQVALQKSDWILEKLHAT